MTSPGSRSKSEAQLNAELEKYNPTTAEDLNAQLDAYNVRVQCAITDVDLYRYILYVLYRYILYVLYYCIHLVYALHLIYDDSWHIAGGQCISD